MNSPEILILLSIIAVTGVMAGFVIAEVNSEQYIRELQEQKCRATYTKLVDYEKCKNIEFTKFWNKLEVKQ